MAKKSHPLIAIIGSANPERNKAHSKWPQYDPPLEDPGNALPACEQLGAELAAAGWDVVVYAGDASEGDDAGFIEPAVVRGYLSDGSPRKGSIRVLYSRASPTPTFAGQTHHPEAFEFHADLSQDWEPSFYRSLADVDAALLIGGGPSGYTGGLVCLGRKIPILAVGTFGASARRVLDTMVHSGIPLRQEDFELLGRPDWTPTSARALVASLKTQKASLDKEREEVQSRLRTRRRSQNAATALGLFVLATLVVPSALVIVKADNWLELALLFVGPLVAGASGGTIRTLLPRTHDVEISTLGSAALGAVAGGITGLLYLTGQLTSASETSIGALSEREYHTFVLFSVAFGFVAGLALDSVYQRLISAGVAESRDI